MFPNDNEDVYEDDNKDDNEDVYDDNNKDNKDTRNRNKKLKPNFKIWFTVSVRFIYIFSFHSENHFFYTRNTGDIL